MKKTFQIIVVVILSAFSLALAFTAYYTNVINQNRGDTIISYLTPEGETPYLIKTYEDFSPCQEDFKVVTFADPHFNGRDEIPGDSAGLTVIENTLKYENPDFVVFAGDIVMGESALIPARQLAELFEDYNQYWGYALGNHDAEHPDGPERDELVSFFAEYEHCVITSAENVFGEGNCIVNIKNHRDEVIQSLVFIDSGGRLTEEVASEYNVEYQENVYDFIKPDQIDWYKSQMLQIEQDNNNKMPNTSLFIHIPLKEYRIAYNQAKEKDEIIFGARREGECDSIYNSGMFEAILDIGSTKAVVCGHDHINDYCVDYEGVKLMYALNIGYNSYFLRKDPLYIYDYQQNHKAQFNDGYTVFSIKNNGDFDIIPKYFQDNPSLFDNLTSVQREALRLDKTLPE